LAHVITSWTSPTMQHLGQIGPAGASRKCGKYNTFVTFLLSYPFSRSCAQVEPLHWFLRWMAQTTCFRPRTVLLEVRTMSDVMREKYVPKSPQKAAWIGSFKPKRRNLYIATSPELLIRRTTYLRTEFRPRKALRGWSAVTPKQTQHDWRPPSWKISMTSYFRSGWPDLDDLDEIR